MNEHDLIARWELAPKIAREAGQHTLRYFRQDNFEIETKGDDSPVTIADREAEQMLRERIAAAFPDDAILGEEFPAKEGTSGFRWILDPIDGTKSFVHGVPLYGTMVGVEYDSRAVIGVVYLPGVDEMAYAAQGQGAWWAIGNGEPRRAKVSDCDRLDRALFVTTCLTTFDQLGRRDAYERLHSAVRLNRTWGDCYGYVLVATGRAEIMIDPAMNVWDAAALQPIMEESGGTFTDWKGVHTIHSGEGVATNGKLLEAVLEKLRG